MPNPLALILQELMGAEGANPLGQSPQAQLTGDALRAAQSQGVKPPLPGDGGMPPMIQLLELLSQMTGDAGFNQPQQPNPDPGFTAPDNSVAGDLQALNTPSGASANSPDNVALLRALMGQ